MGWLSPVVIVAKIIIQSLWLLKTGWDEVLPPDITDRWQTWHNQLSSLACLKLPRWSQFSPEAHVVEVHGFANASKQAYAAVIYLRVVRGSQVLLTLQLAKAHVAPLKTLSIPRLELCAAQLLTRLVRHFLDITPIKVTCMHLWSDSTDVLFWLRDRLSRWPVFVANRCSEIITWLTDAFWHEVRSKDNPADVASRGIDPSSFLDHNLWWHGPEWLVTNSEPWSTTQSISTAHNPVNIKNVNNSFISFNPLEDSNLKSHHCAPSSSSSSIWELMNHCSSLSKLLCVTSYCLRFITRLILKAKSDLLTRSRLAGWVHSAEHVIDDKFTLKELDRARRLWVFLLQNSHYSEEMNCLRAQRPLPKRSALLHLNPILIEGLLRAGGRLRHCLLAEDCRHRLILPSKNHFVELLVQHAHLQTLHGGTQLTLVTLRCQYWIIRGRQVVTSVLYKCLTCLRHSGTSSSQLMGDLPKSRVTPSPAFQHAGVDYAGPFNVRLSKTRGKGTTKGYKRFSSVWLLAPHILKLSKITLARPLLTPFIVSRLTESTALSFSVIKAPTLSAPIISFEKCFLNRPLIIHRCSILYLSSRLLGSSIPQPLPTSEGSGKPPLNPLNGTFVE